MGLFKRVYNIIFDVPARVFLSILVLTIGIKIVAVEVGKFAVESPLDYLVQNDTPYEMLSSWTAYEEQLMARYGYILDKPLKRLIAKPPLYALVTRGVMLITGLDVSLAIFWVHSISVFMGLIWVYRFACLLFGDELATKIALMFPFSLTGASYVYILSYHEPFTVVLIMMIFYYLHKRNDFWVTTLTAFLVLSRSQAIGIILILGLVALYDGWQVWKTMESYSGRANIHNICRATNRIIDSLLTLCAIPLIVFLMWQAAASLATGWQFAPMAAQSLHAHGFGLHKPYELIQPFLSLLDPSLPPFWIPVHLTSILTIMVTVICMGYLIHEATHNHELLPATLYVLFIFLVMTFVGLYSLPRLIHVTILPFVVPMMTHKIGKHFGLIHERVLNATYIVLSIVITGVILHNIFVEYFGYLA